MSIMHTSGISSSPLKHPFVGVPLDRTWIRFLLHLEEVSWLLFFFFSKRFLKSCVVYTVLELLVSSKFLASAS